MLTSLAIQNFGLIERLSIEFTRGLNVLTGETGAGKSILIDALRFVLGERFETSQMREPQLPLGVEAVFELAGKEFKNHPLLAEYLKEETTLILQRSIQPDGRNRIKVNGAALTVTQLKELGDTLVDFHGPHDHQMLLAEHHHAEILDKLIAFDNLMVEYGVLYKEHSDLNSKLEELTQLSQTQHRDRELLEHQIKELEQVPLDESKCNELLTEQTKLTNAERLYQCVQEILNILEDDEAGVNQSLRKAFGPLKTLKQLDPSTASLEAIGELIQEQAGNLTRELSSYGESLTFNEERAQEIYTQVNVYSDLKRKYGPGLKEAQAFYQTIKTKFELIKNFEHNDRALRLELEKVEKNLGELAQKITKKRRAAAEKLKKTIEDELKELGIPHVQFAVELIKVPFHADGGDSVRFFISPNAGEELKPLAHIVSSGEAARVMLALKKALVKVDPIPVLIFDEIDAQIGGRLGTITGKKLKSWLTSGKSF